MQDFNTFSFMLVVCGMGRGCNPIPSDTQSIYIHCRHTIFAHLFFRDLGWKESIYFLFNLFIEMKYEFWTFMTPSFPISSSMRYFLTTPKRIEFLSLLALFLSFPILTLSSSLSLPLLSLSLFQSPSFSHPLTPPSLSLSHTFLSSLSHSAFSVSLSLSFSRSSFPLFLSFHFNDHSPFHPLIITDVLTHYSFLCTEPLSIDTI